MFIKQVLDGRKKMLLLKDVRELKVPRYKAVSYSFFAEYICAVERQRHVQESKPTKLLTIF